MDENGIIKWVNFILKKNINSFDELIDGKIILELIAALIDRTTEEILQSLEDSYSVLMLSNIYTIMDTSFDYEFNYLDQNNLKQNIIALINFLKTKFDEKNNEDNNKENNDSMEKEEEEIIVNNTENKITLEKDDNNIELNNNYIDFNNNTYEIENEKENEIKSIIDEIKNNNLDDETNNNNINNNKNEITKENEENNKKLDVFEKIDIIKENNNIIDENKNDNICNIKESLNFVGNISANNRQESKDINNIIDTYTSTQINKGLININIFNNSNNNDKNNISENDIMDKINNDSLEISDDEKNDYKYQKKKIIKIKDKTKEFSSITPDSIKIKLTKDRANDKAQNKLTNKNENNYTTTNNKSFIENNTIKYRNFYNKIKNIEQYFTNDKKNDDLNLNNKKYSTVISNKVQMNLGIPNLIVNDFEDERKNNGHGYNFFFHYSFIKTTMPIISLDNNKKYVKLSYEMKVIEEKNENISAKNEKEKYILNTLYKIGLIYSNQKNKSYLWNTLIPKLKDGSLVIKIINIYEEYINSDISGSNLENSIKQNNLNSQNNNIQSNWSNIFSILSSKDSFISNYKDHFYNNNQKLFLFLYDILYYYNNKLLDDNNDKNSPDKTTTNFNYQKIKNNSKKFKKINQKSKMYQSFYAQKFIKNRKNNICNKTADENDQNNLSLKPISNDVSGLRKKANYKQKECISFKLLLNNDDIESVLNFIKKLGLNLNLTKNDFYLNEMTTFKSGIAVFKIINKLEKRRSLLPKINVNPLSSFDCVDNYKKILHFLYNSKISFSPSILNKEKELYLAKPDLILKLLLNIKDIYKNENNSLLDVTADKNK